MNKISIRYLHPCVSSTQLAVFDRDCDLLLFRNLQKTKICIFATNTTNPNTDLSWSLTIQQLYF